MKVKQKKVFIIIYIVVVFLMFLYTTLSRPLANLDEIWNFNISKEIAKGNIVYKDISLITTPLFYFINAIPLKIFANELFVYRITESIMLSLMCYLSFKIFQKIHNSEYKAFALSGLLIVLLYTIVANNYNFLVILWLLVIINLELSKIEKNKIWYNILIGFIAGLAILTKQTVGIMIAVMTIMRILLDITDKKELKDGYKNIVFRIIGIIIPILLFICYCLVTNCMTEFIDYTILGISTFNNKVSLIKYFNWGTIPRKIGIISIILISIVGLGYIIYNRVKNIKSNSATIVMIYALSSMILTYPIADNEHFILAFYIWVVVVLIGLTKILEIVEKKNSDIKASKIINYIIFLFLGFYTLFNIYFHMFQNIKTYYDSNNKTTEYKYYKNIVISDGIKQKINEYCKLYDEYKAQNKELVILDSEAAVYMIPTDSYRKNYDMFNIGNFGSKGEDGIIEDIKNSENKVYLLKGQEKNRNWQTPSKVLNYVKKNYKFKETRIAYDLYE